MDTKELRIGNLVYKGELFPVEVVEVITGFNIETDRHNFCDINKFRPIPITEEWLLKFGFKIEGVTGMKDKFIVWMYDVGDYCFMKYNSKDNKQNNDLKVYSTPLANIKYVHQLQNLYYSLTNTELCLTN